MLSAALCVQEMLMDDPKAKEDDVFEFIESNFRDIIRETIAAEMERGRSRRRMQEGQAWVEETESPEDPFSAETDGDEGGRAS